MRRRIYLVGCPSSQSAGQILFESAGLSRDFKEIRKAWEDDSAAFERSFRKTSGGGHSVEWHGMDARLKLHEDGIVTTLTHTTEQALTTEKA